MKIFISGGAGFIGSHFAAKVLLREEFSEVVIYDNFSSGSCRHLSSVRASSRVRVVEGDLKHLGLLTHEMAGASLVVHFAANPDIAKAVSEPDIDFWQGTYLTHNVLEAMRINGVTHMLYTSGSGVYGEVYDQSLSEEHGPCSPISTYGASKLACEALISAYSHMFSFKSRALRFANVVGPLQTHGVGYDFIRRLMTNPASLTILGDGTQSKSYIYISDVIDAMLLVYDMSHQSNQPFDVFNVATDDCITVTEIADIACNTLGLQTGNVRYLYTGGDRGWKGDVPKVIMNVDKLKKLGWRTSRDSRQAVSEAIRSMLDEVRGISK